ncbi:hypothetical protein DSM104329_01088 [Capillimicrobium parvum]|uniref:HTH cro/C1-type domain-containing protein n=2 Tax=Capillimicrobium parvum TaxID=2884022 RepID=A0A9E6XUL9_9ACTN|nr:hypothetical protein DSM104329_01088 [Capillimicrobium parvum]
MVHTARTDADLSIRELARRADVTASQISRVEKQEIRKPSTDFLLSIARALGKPAEPLLYMAGHITDEEFDRLTVGWREVLDVLRTSAEIIEGSRHDGRRDIAAQGMFFGPGVSEWAVSLLTLGGREAERELRDLLAMWQALTPVRRRLLLACAADQERLSQADRRDNNQGRYRVDLRLEEQ